MTLAICFLAGFGAGVCLTAAAHYYLVTSRSWWP
jgi:hypothetical protein